MGKVRMRYFHMKGLRLLVCILIAAMVGVTLSVGPYVSQAVAKEKVWKLEIQSFTVPSKWDCQWTVPLKFIELVKKHTKGRVEMRLHPVNEIVGTREIWTSVCARTIDGGVTAGPIEAGNHPELLFHTATIRTMEEFYKVIHGGALDIINEQTLKDNVRMVGSFPLMNYWAVSMKKGHVKNLADFKGKKIRGMGGVGNIFLKKAGAGIVTLPMSEVPSALQTGVVDGILTGLAGLYAMNLWDVAPYFTAANMGNFDQWIILNKDLYAEFPPDVKAGIDAAQLELEQWYLEWDNAFRKEIKADVEKKGIKWYYLHPDESQRWRELIVEASITMVMEGAPEVGRRLFEVVEKVTGHKVLK